MMKTFAITAAAQNPAKNSLSYVAELLTAMKNDMQENREEDFAAYQNIAIECFSKISGPAATTIRPFIEFLIEFMPKNPAEQEMFSRSLVRLVDIFEQSGCGYVEEILPLKDASVELPNDSHLSCSYDDTKKSSSVHKQLAVQQKSLDDLIARLDEVANEVIRALRLSINPILSVAASPSMQIPDAILGYGRFRFAPPPDDIAVQDTKESDNEEGMLFKMDDGDDEELPRTAGFLSAPKLTGP